ncbi:GIY-YIG nuclease family protein [Mucilaginibacter endophyticus]|uniref:GIY-YIG nuclease family protein n=1 Tax=Mucilaginibacter endophyticus TaxID=2675003 RepID=UPI001FC9B929|nr:GIY-YIG nuclease family protein [Mucilaginibacter endophyticus]
MWNHNYYVYITTNPRKTVLYIGVTNDISVRVLQHLENKGTNKSFTGKYYCYHLVYYEHFTHMNMPLPEKRKSKNGVEKRKMH